MLPVHEYHTLVLSVLQCVSDMDSTFCWYQTLGGMEWHEYHYWIWSLAGITGSVLSIWHHSVRPPPSSTTWSILLVTPVSIGWIRNDLITCSTEVHHRLRPFRGKTMVPANCIFLLLLLLLLLLFPNSLIACVRPSNIISKKKDSAFNADIVHLINVCIICIIINNQASMDSIPAYHML